MKHLRSVLSAIVLGSVAFSGPALAQGKPTVGIAMPTKASARWIDDGNNIVKVLKERGYNTDLQYAEDDIPNQLSQIVDKTNWEKVLIDGGYYKKAQIN
jgi:putative multiple sugar transport system substrate-binding protein